MKINKRDWVKVLKKGDIVVINNETYEITLIDTQYNRMYFSQEGQSGWAFNQIEWMNIFYELESMKRYNNSPTQLICKLKFK